MANYQLGPVIGKLGGAEVQKIPVEAVADGIVPHPGIIMHTVHVPEGETWLVVLSGNLNPRYTANTGPQLSIGEVSTGRSLPAGYTSIAAEVTGTADIAFSRNTQIGSDSFSGHIYTAPLP